MIYQSALTLPAQTTEDAPVREEFTIPRGTINRLSILFPDGCAGLAHIIISHNEKQIWPTTPGRSFTGNNTYADFEESYDLPDAWNTIRVVGWNEDDSYPHVINVWLLVLPVESAAAWYAALGIPGWPSAG